MGDEVQPFLVFMLASIEQVEERILLVIMFLYVSENQRVHICLRSEEG